LPDFRLLRDHEMPAGIQWGCEYRTWCVNPMMYCSFLLRVFSHHGGKIRKETLHNPKEIFVTEGFKDVTIVANCSGYGFGDPEVFPIRGE
jgi:D-amino-acid oxidase